MNASECRELIAQVQNHATALHNASFDGRRSTRTETECFEQACNELVPVEWRVIIRVAAQGWWYYGAE